jgi:hypothetical protein
MKEPVPPAVRDLIDRCLSSMEHVELLLWLAAESARTADRAVAAGVIHAPADVADRRLSDLRECGLIERTAEDKNLYRYQPKSAALRAAVEELSTMYNQRPVTLVRAIYERPVSPVRSFADAFRFRGDE